MTGRRSRVAMLSVLLLTFVLASCAGKPPAKEKEEVTVRVAIAPGVVHLDAQDTNTRYAFEVTQLCYENLFERDKDGKLQPWLVSDWSVSGDGLVYTFHVREGVKFHDGTPLDAEAVKVNLERKIQRDQPLASMLKPYLQEMRVTGPMTLELRFNKPMFDLPGILAAKTFAIYSPKALREQQPEWFKENMVGTGPFILKEYRKGEYAKFVRNPDYWLKGYPKVDAIEMTIVPEAATRAAMLESGQVDIAERLSGADVKRFMAQSGGPVEVRVEPVADAAFIILNNLRPGLNEVKVRQAMNYAVDRQAIAERAYSGIVGGPAQAQVIASRTEGFVSANRYDRNMDKAKALLEEAGWKIGPDGYRYKGGKKLSFTLWAAEQDPGEVATAEIVQQNLQEIGIEVKITLIDPATARAKVTVPPEKCEYDMLVWSMGAYTGYVDFAVNTFYHSQAWPPKYYNRAYYKNPRVDELIDMGNKAVTAQERYRLFGEAIRLVSEDAPTIQLLERAEAVAYRKGVSGVYVEPAAITYVLKFVEKSVR